jgi:hypothetical protein
MCVTDNFLNGMYVNDSSSLDRLQSANWMRKAPFAIKRGSWLELSYGPPWAHYLVGYQDRLLGGPLGLPGLRYMAPDGVEHKDYGGEVLG